MQIACLLQRTACGRHGNTCDAVFAAHSCTGVSILANNWYHTGPSNKQCYPAVAERAKPATMCHYHTLGLAPSESNGVCWLWYGAEGGVLVVTRAVVVWPRISTLPRRGSLPGCISQSWYQLLC